MCGSEEVPAAAVRRFLLDRQLERSLLFLRNGDAKETNDAAAAVYLICQSQINVILNSSEPFEFSRGGFRNKIILVVDNKSARESIVNLNFRPGIDTELYLLDTGSRCVEELYFIQSKQIWQNVSCEGFHVMLKTSAIPRRMDLRGAKLKCLTSRETPYINVDNSLPSEHLDKITTTRSGDIVQVPSNKIKGIFMDLMDIITRELNIEPMMYMRTDLAWGTYDVATGRSSGMVANLHHRDVDIILTSLSMDTNRERVAHWLVPLTEERMSLFVMRGEHEKSTQQNWMIFLRPFSWNLWVWGCLVNMVLVFASIKGIASYLKQWRGLDSTSGCSFTLVMWAAFSSYFGMRPDLSGPAFGTTSINIIVFFMSLVGTLIFMCYRAALTSELSVETIQPPFANVDEFIASDYR